MIGSAAWQNASINTINTYDLSYYGIYIPDYLIFPLGTGSLFYAQGTFLFHVLGIGIIYLPLGVITYLILRLKIK